MSNEVNSTIIPTHLAFILDGNGRWAKLRGKPRSEGHKQGVKAVQKTVDNAKKLGVKICSFFVFSTENWKRPQPEIDAIFKLLRDFIKNDTKKYEKSNIRLTYMGDLTKLPPDITSEILSACERTKANTGFIVNICINYGGRADIVNAVNKLLKEKKESVTEEEFAKYLYSAELPDPDMIVRTSGELRLSNYMLYQGAYSEFYFSNILWPDFNMEHLKDVIQAYQNRDRRFGNVK